MRAGGLWSERAVVEDAGLGHSTLSAPAHRECRRPRSRLIRMSNRCPCAGHSFRLVRGIEKRVARVGRMRVQANDGFSYERGEQQAKARVARPGALVLTEWIAEQACR